MILEYDLNVRALYIRLSDCGTYRTAAVDDNTMADLDADGRVTGIEVVSFDHPWALGVILRDYLISDRDAAALRAYFPMTECGMTAPLPVSFHSTRFSEMP